MGAIELKEALNTKCPLRFDQDGKFRILMVSDIHGGIGYEKEKTVRAMQALVDEAKPQLVILGGDIAGPGTIHVENEDQLRSLLDDISSPMEKAGISPTPFVDAFLSLCVIHKTCSVTGWSAVYRIFSFLLATLPLLCS